MQGLNQFLTLTGFVSLYLALDAASFIDPLHGLNITPWNPAPALGLVYLLRRERNGRLILAATVIFSEWVVRGVPLSWWGSLLSALTLAAGYVLMAEFLRPRLPAGSLLDNRRALFSWLLPIALGSLLISIVYVSSLALFGLLPQEAWLTGVIQFWVGDGVGFAVSMPLFWWLSNAHGRQLLKSFALRWESAGYALLSLLALWLAFAWSGGQGFKLFYLLFLPLVWASARQGMAGAVISSSLLQVEVAATVQVLDYSAFALAELQILALAMALIAFFIGGVVDEQRRTSDELRQSLRLAAAGEMAGALAHELNQPLTALSAYASACEKLMARGESGERLNQAIRGMLQESGRAGDVVRRLRDFFRTGATQLAAVRLASIVAQATRHYQDQAVRLRVDLVVGELPDVGLFADRLQLELVLRNLLANAFDAALASTRQPRVVRLNAETLPGSRVCLVIEDSGQGLSPSEQGHAYEALRSSKSSGLGLGLMISKAIVETHGGSLWGEMADHGIFKIILPTQAPEALS